MGKNKIYVVVFVLLIVLVILLGFVSMFSGSRSKQKAEQFQDKIPVPTSNYVPPTPTPQGLTVNLITSITPTSGPVTTIFDLAYPLKFNDLIMDYLPQKRRIIIYYPKDKIQAEDVFKQFTEQYSTSSSQLTQIKVDYIGLTRDPNEPVPGKLLQ